MRTTPTRTPRNRGGFSLLEMVIAVLILGILAAVAAPRYSNAMSTFRSDAVARRVAADLNRMRRFAIANSTTVTVTFDTAAESYQTSDVPRPDKKAGAWIITAGDELENADIVTADFDGANTLTFDHHGQPLVGGSAMTSGSITISVLSSHQTITIEPVTGRAY